MNFSSVVDWTLVFQTNFPFIRRAAHAGVRLLKTKEVGSHHDPHLPFSYLFHFSFGFCR